jgi:NADH:ubiquinone oxidoreductase subunit 3 (subunit A)
MLQVQSNIDIITDAVFAFVVVFAVATLIYAIGRLMSPKTKKSEDEEASYACGEKTVFHRITLNISLHKYLVFFIILDSSVLLIAFAAFSTGVLFSQSTWPLFVVYLAILLAAMGLLYDGGKE